MANISTYAAGWSLFETIIVIAILSALIALALPSFHSLLQQSDELNSKLLRLSQDNHSS